jgi:hypothetical protein
MQAADEQQRDGLGKVKQLFCLPDYLVDGDVTARARKRRLPRTVSRISGMTPSTCSATARSAAKLSLLPRY